MYKMYVDLFLDLRVNAKCIMSQNGQTHFNHLESFLMSDHFGTFCNKLLNLIHLNIVGIKCIF